MKRGLFVTIASLFLFTIAAAAQEGKNEVSVQGTGFFTKDSNGDGISQTTTNTGGLEAGSAITSIVGSPWKQITVSTETRNAIFQVVRERRVQAEVHGVTGDVAVNLSLRIHKLSP